MRAAVPRRGGFPGGTPAQLWHKVACSVDEFGSYVGHGFVDPSALPGRRRGHALSDAHVQRHRSSAAVDETAAAAESLLISTEPYHRRGTFRMPFRGDTHHPAVDRRAETPPPRPSDGMEGRVRRRRARGDACQRYSHNARENQLKETR